MSSHFTLMKNDPPMLSKTAPSSRPVPPSRWEFQTPVPVDLSNFTSEKVRTVTKCDKVVIEL
jgi:hypothetical protein